MQAVSVTRAIATEPLSPAKEVDVDTPDKEWTPSSWKNFFAYQQPEYPDAAAVEDVFGQLSDSPPLVFAGEARQLEEKLGAAALGKAFLLQVHIINGRTIQWGFANSEMVFLSRCDSDLAPLTFDLHSLLRFLDLSHFEY